ncbi:MAG TPA: YeeE/YedE thiosulfate transporter family protein [Longimicrobiales bacterium]
MSAFFPIVMSEETRLLTAIVLGGLFGFALERAGFGSARKLVGQFYLHDMTVFKVMFTAIIVAMAGLFTLTQLGFVDLTAIWINPTFIWSQVIGGFLLGVGFVISGLCPGTSVVSAASGRIDAYVAFAGIFVGTLVFALLVDWIPPLDRLYHAGSMGTSLLPDLLHVPAPVIVFGVVLMAVGGFIGAEIVERRFAAQHEERVVESTPRTLPRMRLAVTGAIAVVALIGLAALKRSQPAPRAVTMAAIDPLAVARRIIARDPNLLIVDVRARPDKVVPGAVAAKPDTSALPLLGDALPGRTTVVVYDATGTLRTVPASWPRELDYHYLAGGFDGWQKQVLTPASAAGSQTNVLEQVREQNQVAAYFSGATVQAGPVAAPPPAAGGGGAKKKKAGGC